MAVCISEADFIVNLPFPVRPQINSSPLDSKGRGIEEIWIITSLGRKGAVVTRFQPLFEMFLRVRNKFKQRKQIAPIKKP